MNIGNSMRHDMGGFALDTNKITLHSVSKRNVELPYHGPMPERVTGTNYRISFNVQPARTPRVTLVVDCDGKDQRFPLDATPDEIETILGQLFNDPNKSKPGLSGYWLGVWQMDFFGWRETQNRHHLREIIEHLPTAERAALLKSLQHTDKATV